MAKRAAAALPCAVPLCITPTGEEHRAHWWLVTNARSVEDEPVYHHECVRCGAQKDVPVSFSSPRSWVHHPKGGTR